MGRTTTGARLRLGKELSHQLTALREVLDGNPSEIGIVRQAVRELIQDRLKDRVLRQRYESALKVQRGGTEGDNVVALPTGK
jgi:hypothetical protein